MIYHLSDHHGAAHKLPELSGIIVVTGDMLPNYCTMGERREHGDSWRQVEIDGQTEYVQANADHYRRAFGSKPVVCVGGNHDYIDFAAALRSIGINAVSVEDGVQVIDGLRFGGFRQVRHMAGEWEGEVHDFSPYVEQVMSLNLDVLVVHQPVDGILSDDGGCGHGRGIEMYGELFYSEHNIKLVCCGHIHNQGGQVVNRGGIQFSNAAHTINTINL